MNDRFKFKAVLHQNKYEEYQLEEFLHQRVFDVMSINLGIEYSTIEIIAEYPNGDCAVREIDDKDIDLIQSTGLKDKNGKLIYEGDIVEVINCRGANAVVEYNLEGAKFMLKGEKFAPSALQHIRKDYFEVIGNIHENPELLEGSK